MKWSPQQDEALLAVSAWLKDEDGPQVFYLGGYAGTGKSTLAVHLAGEVKKILYMAFTGKASLVMQSKGCTNASTVHSAIYILTREEDGQLHFRLNKKSRVKDCDLVCIDECSMINKKIGGDLLSFGKKILVIGDPFQLPPVEGAGFFTAGAPDYMLTEVHRQAKDNPIIKLSMDIRHGKVPHIGDYGAVKVIPKIDIPSSIVLEADQVLVGMNRTRIAYNKRIRELKGFTDHIPETGERLICLKNDYDKHTFNGSLWDVWSSNVYKKDHNFVEMEIVTADEPEGSILEVKTHKDLFSYRNIEIPWKLLRGTQHFTYGYAITVHKAQGSQWDNVFLFNEGQVFREHYLRWLYTGATRAAETLTIAV